MKQLNRITADPSVIRGLRVTTGMLTGLVDSGKNTEQILALYPYLESEDITQALRYAAWRAEEIDLPLAAA